MRRSVANKYGKAPLRLGPRRRSSPRSLRTKELDSSALLQNASAGVRPRSRRPFSRAAIIVFARFARKLKGAALGKKQLFVIGNSRPSQGFIRNSNDKVLLNRPTTG